MRARNPSQLPAEMELDREKLLCCLFQMEDKTPPRDIEQVPFRRQDRRILNSRKKRVMDRKLIRCIVLTGLLMLAAGAGLIAVWWMYEEGGQTFLPFFATAILTSCMYENM